MLYLLFGGCYEWNADHELKRTKANGIVIKRSFLSGGLLRSSNLKQDNPEDLQGS